MTALDQAFIKAYRQQTAAPGTPLQSARPVPLSEALEELSRHEPADVRLDAPQQEATADVLEEALNQTATAASDETDQPPAGEEPAREIKYPIEAAPTLDGLDFSGVVHRLDREVGVRPESSEPAGPEPAPDEEQAVPTPHIEAAAFTGRVDDSVADEPADAEAATGEEPTGEEPTGEEPTGEEPSTEAEPGARPITAADGVFQPMLQVDHYTWPSACRRLGGAAAHPLDLMTDGLVAAANRGQKVLAIGGCRNGEGATTLLLCAARRLADRGHKVAMVDANLADPQLADQLGLLPQFGWEETLAGRLPLDEVVIESSHNQLAVLPLLSPFSGTGELKQDRSRLVDSIGVLADHYDFVLVDLGPLEKPEVVGGALAQGIAARLDAVVLVQDVRTTTEDQLAEIRRYLSAAGIAQPGIIQNFVPA